MAPSSQQGGVAGERQGSVKIKVLSSRQGRGRGGETETPGCDHFLTVTSIYKVSCVTVEEAVRTLTLKPDSRLR